MEKRLMCAGTYMRRIEDVTLSGGGLELSTGQ